MKNETSLFINQKCHPDIIRCQICVQVNIWIVYHRRKQGLLQTYKKHTRNCMFRINSTRRTLHNVNHWGPRRPWARRRGWRFVQKFQKTARTPKTIIPQQKWSSNPNAWGWRFRWNLDHEDHNFSSLGLNLAYEGYYWGSRLKPWQVFLT
jgi:hypothetical protein